MLSITLTPSHREAAQALALTPEEEKKRQEYGEVCRLYAIHLVVNAGP